MDIGSNLGSDDHVVLALALADSAMNAIHDENYVLLPRLLTTLDKVWANGIAGDAGCQARHPDAMDAVGCTVAEVDGFLHNRASQLGLCPAVCPRCATCGRACVNALIAMVPGPDREVVGHA